MHNLIRKNCQLLIYACITSGALAFLLPWGIAQVDMTLNSNDPSLFLPPNPGDPVRLSIWELNTLRRRSYISTTELSIESETTRLSLDRLTALARSSLIAYPIALIAIIPTSWKFLSSKSKKRVVILLIASIIIQLIFLLVTDPGLTGPFIQKTVVEKVSYVWPVILLMIVAIGTGLFGSGYIYLVSMKAKQRPSS